MSTRTRGVTLVELIVFIVIVGVAMSALFAIFGTITKASADPQVRKQVLAIAESLMDEVALMPFTYCDPDDANAATALNAAGCATTPEAIGPEALNVPPGGPAETRTGSVRPFDNVNDYHGFSMGPGIQDITNAPIAGLGAYSANITVTQTALASGVDLIPAADSLLISVTVTGPGGVSTTLEGYRTSYAPNTVP